MTRIPKSRFLSRISSHLTAKQITWSFIEPTKRIIEAKINGKSILFGAKPIKFWPLNSELSSSITRDKDITAHILKNNGIKRPKTTVLFLKTTHNAREVLKKIIKIKKISFPCVIKPNTSMQGRGISIVYESTSLFRAIQYANKFSKNVLIQKLIQGEDMRIFFFKDKPLVLIKRIGENIQANGKDTIKTIIQKKYREHISRSTNPGFQISFKSFMLAYGNTIFREKTKIEIYPIMNRRESNSISSIQQISQKSWKNLGSIVSKKLHLNFFTIDCKILKNNDIVVLEVNSNPGVESVYRASKKHSDALIDFLIQKSFNLQ